MQKPAKHHFTPEEYLALEGEAEYRSEYYSGEIFAMAGGSINHNQIAGNLYAALSQTLAAKNCRVFISDMRLRIEKKDLFTYPDIMIICGKPEFYKNRNDTLTNPLVVVEVLSESTKNYDRGEKFEFYRSVAPLEEYILVDQYKFHVEQFYIGDLNKWTLSEFNGEADVLQLAKIDFEIPLKAIYDQVDFEIT